MLQQTIEGKDKESILAGKANRLKLHEKVQSIADGGYIDKDIDEISSSGFVIDSLEASLWAFYHTENFKDAVLKAVNLGDDADTVGAITGQIAGAYYGLDTILTEWVNKLAKKDLIFDLIDKLYSKRN